MHISIGCRRAGVMQAPVDFGRLQTNAYLFVWLGGSGLNKLRFSALNWEQEQSLAKVFETLISPQMNFYLRLAISAMQMFTAVLIARYGDLCSAFCVAVLVFFTLYPVLYYFLGSEKRSIANYKMTSPVLGWIFVLQRPVAVMALWLNIARKEIMIFSHKLSMEKK